MQEAMRQRLDALRVEQERGRRHLELLDRQRQELGDRLLRIGGAIQVLDELLSAEQLISAEATVVPRQPLPA
jgi:hypothetical protein